MQVREEGEKEKEGDRNGIGEKERGRKRGRERGGWREVDSTIYCLCNRFFYREGREKEKRRKRRL